MTQMKSQSRRFAVVLAATACIGCAATTPVLYPNEKVKSDGWEVARADIADCTREAEEFGAAGGREAAVAKDAAGRAAIGAGVGAAAGAAGGAVHGDAGRGAASGAAGGAAAGVMGALIDSFRRREPDPVYKNFVIRCLRERGYEVIGWE